MNDILGNSGQGDNYEPAEDPGGDRPGGSRVRFESVGGVEQSIGGGSADDIAASMLGDTAINTQILNRKIISVQKQHDALGAGPTTEIQLRLDNGKILIVRGPMLEIKLL